jgi:peroxiredoxin
MRRGDFVWLAITASVLLAAVAAFVWLAPGVRVSALPAPQGQLAAATQPAPAPTPTQATGPYPGDLAPDFRLAGLDLQEIRLSDHHGHRVLLNFFTTWCESCRLEMPGVQSQYEKHRDHGWVVIGIDMFEPLQAITVFRDEFGLTFPVALDLNGNVSHTYEIRGTPTNILIDAEGWIVDRRLGYMSEEQIEEMLETVS